jgi:hypothetical protein
MRSIIIGSALAIFISGVTLSSQEWQPKRTPDGQPDISGIIWTTGPDEVAYTGDLETGVADPIGRKIQGRGLNSNGRSLIIDPPNGRIPYQPWAAAKRAQIPHGRPNAEIGRTVVDRDPNKLREVRPQYMCLPAAPRVNFDRDFRITQTPGYVIMTWEWSHGYRIIPIDGRPRISPRVKMAMGDARGRWEGNTLVVETTNINDWDWLDAAATFFTDKMTAVERYTILDANMLDYRVTITDPNVFTQPWTAAFKMRRAQSADYEVLEHACVEGERAVEHMLGKERNGAYSN